MKKIIFSSIFMFVALFFLIVKLSSVETNATQSPTISTSSSLSTGTGAMMNQKQATSGYTTVRPKAGRMTRTS